MPDDDLPSLDSEQTSRVLRSATAPAKMRQKTLDTTSFLSDANYEFRRTMNKIIFDKRVRGESTLGDDRTPSRAAGAFVCSHWRMPSRLSLATNAY